LGDVPNLAKRGEIFRLTMLFVDPLVDPSTDPVNRPLLRALQGSGASSHHLNHPAKSSELKRSWPSPPWMSTDERIKRKSSSKRQADDVSLEEVRALIGVRPWRVCPGPLN
jgi:hypothetical protein